MRTLNEETLRRMEEYIRERQRKDLTNLLNPAGADQSRHQTRFL